MSIDLNLFIAEICSPSDVFGLEQSAIIVDNCVPLQVLGTIKVLVSVLEEIEQSAHDTVA